jgi:hypothetical protein
MVANQRMEEIMPIGDIIYVSAIIIAFGAFAIVLGWADHRTHGFRAPEQPSHDKLA